MQSEDRLSIFFGIMIFLVMHLIFYFIVNAIVSSLIKGSFQHIITFYILLAIIALIAVSISILIYQKIVTKSDNKGDIEKKKLNYSSNLFKSFRLHDPRQTIVHILLLVCVVYIPLDLISYLMPGVFEYEAQSILASSFGNYLLWQFGLMILATLIVHFCVAFREELYFRAYMMTIMNRKIDKARAFIYSSILFGIAHFSYFFSSANENSSIFFPIWWTMNALIIGIVAGYYFLEKRQFFPIFAAHWINNIISALALRNYILGVPFLETFLNIYLPILIIGIIILIIKNNIPRVHIPKIWKLLKQYWQLNEKYYDFLLILIFYLFTLFAF